MNRAEFYQEYIAREISIKRTELENVIVLDEELKAYGIDPDLENGTAFMEGSCSALNKGKGYLIGIVPIKATK